MPTKQPKKIVVLNKKTKKMLDELQVELEENGSLIVRNAITEYYKKNKKKKGK